MVPLCLFPIPSPTKPFDTSTCTCSNCVTLLACEPIINSALSMENTSCTKITAPDVKHEYFDCAYLYIVNLLRTVHRHTCWRAYN